MKAPARASCTWGEGPDVLVVVNRPRNVENGWGWVAYPDSGCFGHAGSFGLTAAEARVLAAQLLAGAECADRFERDCAATCAKKKETVDG